MKTFYTALTFFFIFGAIVASPLELAADSPERTLACCPTTKSKNRCNDGTKGTPYCGKGPCNIAGCACKGGCR
ncbi:hypothetical protein PENCOP_c016G07071 [Penicillium coprophilum]|uniref:Uncharacterized protein n=1 Tax=Penicillium coprophilum TaxID=36646 RepID=A0A1V6U8L3_9EURO|nr:hypothetical protein PENCOP_c016G07071 [Penicillium coprophilum]